MHLRRMEIEDAKEIEIIEKQSFALPWSKYEIEKTFLAGNNLFCIATIQGEVVGYIGMLMVLDEGNIINIAVKSDFRRCGIAKGLLVFLIAEAKKEEVKHITLEVRQSNAIAIKMYESLGFEAVGIRKNFYERPTENAVIMWKNNI